MLAGAVMHYLAAEGMADVRTGGFGDYSQAGAPAVALHASLDADVELDSGAYGARLQIRGRAANAIAAENIARTALEHVLAADGTVLQWVDPTGGPGRHYLLEGITIVNRPTWFATPEPGEEASANVRMHVTEVPEL